ncbi:MAG: hypothetical protein RJA32_692 [Pseudomonadota bacterium]|jgi:hypothetical protein
MSENGVTETKATFLGSLLSLFASSSTLICCAIPALLVSLGAGAALASLVSVFPQIVWISEHKEIIFSFATVLMIVAGFIQWRNQKAPCPVDPDLRNACLKTRKISLRIYFLSLALMLVGAWFAFIQPLLSST